MIVWRRASFQKEGQGQEMMSTYMAMIIKPDDGSHGDECDGNDGAYVGGDNGSQPFDKVELDAGDGDSDGISGVGDL